MKQSEKSSEKKMIIMLDGAVAIFEQEDGLIIKKPDSARSATGQPANRPQNFFRKKSHLNSPSRASLYLKTPLFDSKVQNLAAQNNSRSPSA
jgi:hypothetical protein